MVRLFISLRGGEREGRSEASTGMSKVGNELVAVGVVPPLHQPHAKWHPPSHAREGGMTLYEPYCSTSSTIRSLSDGVIVMDSTCDSLVNNIRPPCDPPCALNGEPQPAALSLSL